MSKEMLILTIVSLSLVLGMGDISYATGPIKDTANIQEHIKVHLEKVKLSNPKKYQEMMEKTGGNPADCTDCHVEVAEKHNFPVKEKIEGIQPMRK
jgi:hypothetical protein